MRYATTWTQAWYEDPLSPELVDDEPIRHTRKRLVVVEADNVDEAREKTGLVVEDFHLATPDELAEWEETVGGPLTERDLRMLLGLVAADIREIRRKRRRDRKTGRWPAGSERLDKFDSNRARAFRMICMGAKLDVLMEDAAEDDGYYEDDSAANAARNGGKDVVVHD